MNRQTLLVALVAAAAVAAFGVGAATLDDALGPSDPATGGDGEFVDRQGRYGAGPADDAPPVGGSCETCPATGIQLTTTGLLPTVPRTVLLALAGLGSVVTGLLWLRAGRGTGAAVDGVADDHAGLDTDDDAGSTAAWTPDDPPASNPVYRAWRDVADAIDASDPETTTPGEYAALARERGWNGVAVDTLTDLFRRVRYGRAEVTDERAERARSAAERARGGTEHAGAGDPAAEDGP
ncbi:protein of unknown function [Halomicrobium zhouii]|uniref:Protein-glutamine gamma-glutamyltransferase-like C-terminal domain-containing protein n=1 Tax=Halomicrobium zhouii TaxID=767519 RepID=A0A1I6KAB2_9EURY|nr:DUF4129 domain-containing protein [Halomicrobium zhouii]SFR88074.1 protein of unknown function [Halomicrobium zhouii]